MSTSIADQLEIQQLLARYSHAADLHPPEAMRDIFTEDGRFHIEAMGIDAHGIDRIIEFFTEMRAGMEGTYHVNSNLVIDVDGDSATAVSYLTTLRSGEKPEIAGIARYQDQLVKTPEGWRIRARYVEF